eukprot:2766079-Pleurochrysis_carterae.AAC.2
MVDHSREWIVLHMGSNIYMVTNGDISNYYPYIPTLEENSQNERQRKPRRGTGGSKGQPKWQKGTGTPLRTCGTKAIWGWWLTNPDPAGGELVRPQGTQYTSPWQANKTFSRKGVCKTHPK